MCYSISIFLSASLVLFPAYTHLSISRTESVDFCWNQHGILFGFIWWTFSHAFNLHRHIVLPSHFVDVSQFEFITKPKTLLYLFRIHFFLVLLSLCFSFSTIHCVRCYRFEFLVCLRSTTKKGSTLLSMPFEIRMSCIFFLLLSALRCAYISEGCKKRNDLRNPSRVNL